MFKKNQNYQKKKKPQIYSIANRRRKIDFSGCEEEIFFSLHRKYFTDVITNVSKICQR